MRILIAGSSQSWAIEHHYIRHLTALGVEVSLFSPSDYISYSIANRLLLRAGSVAPYSKANEALLDAVKSVHPETLWVFKGAEIRPELLRQVRKTGVKLVNYNPDHPFVRTYASHGGSNVPDSVPLYDLHFCYSRVLSDFIEREHSVRAAYLPFAFEMEDGVFERISSGEEKKRVGFVGNPDLIRVRIIRQLAACGLQVDVYGHGWKKHLPNHPQIEVFNAVYDTEFWEILRQYRIQLNIFRPHNIGSHNMRSFEVPAAGGIMLAPDSPEHRAFFEPHQEAFFYHREEDIAPMCWELLAADTLSQVRENARRKSVSEDYSYRNRANIALQALQIL